MQQRLGPSAPAPGAPGRAAGSRRTRRRARWPPARRSARAPERLGQQPGLGRLAAAVDPLEGDQPARGRSAASRLDSSRARRRRASTAASVGSAGRRPPSWRRPSSWRPPSWPWPSSWPAAFLAAAFLAWPPSGARVDRRPGRPALGQQLGGPLDGDRLDVVALAQRRVGGAVGHVGTEPPVPQHDGQLGLGVGARAPRSGPAAVPAPARLGLGEEGQRLVEGRR